jgi:hypothetical protein
VGIGDDGAVVRVPPGVELVLTSDTLESTYGQICCALHICPAARQGPGTLHAALLAHCATAHPWRNTSAPVNQFGSDYLGHSKKDLIRYLLWVIVHSEDRVRVRHRLGIQVMQKVK